MTRSEFNDIDDYYDLEQCARDYGYFDEVFGDGLYTRNEFEDRAFEQLRDRSDLQSARSFIDDLPSSNFDRYTYDEYYNDWSGTDDGDGKFYDYKDELYTLMNDNDEWDDEDPEPKEEEEEEIEPEPPAEGESSDDIMDIVRDIVDEYEVPEESSETEMTEEEERMIAEEVAEELMMAFENYATPVQIKEEEEEPDEDENKVNLSELWEAC